VATQQPILQEQRSVLSALVRAWDRRLRLQQTVRWLPQSLLPGLVLGIGLAVASRLRPVFVSEQILNMTLIACGAGLGFLLLGMLLYPRSVQRAAQTFDVMFSLNERVSTALELINGRIRTNTEFAGRQLDDAIARASSVRARDYIPLQVRWGDWALVAVLSAVLAALLLFPNPMEANIDAPVEANPAIEDAADVLRDITEEVAADTALSEQDRQDLLQQLDESIETLEREDITTEEAFAELSDVESELQNQADALGEQLSQQQSALSGAQQALNGAFPEGEEAASEELGGDASELSEQLEDIAELGADSENPQSLADALNEAAEALRETNPQAAQALEDAAQALQNGDQQSFEESLSEAQDALDQQGQQQQNQQQAQQNLQQGADQTQQQQQNLQQGQQDGQQGQQQQGQEGQQPQQGEQQQNGQQGQDGEQQEGAFVLATPQSGQESQANAATGEQDGEQQGGQSMQAPNSGGQQGAQQSSQSSLGGQQGNSASAGGANSGAGDQDTGAVEQGFRSDGGPVQSNNNPDGEGVEEFDPIYAPQRIGGDGGPSISLETEDGSSPLVEGDFSENPTGETSVPYNEVFSDYSGQASQALESDYIPLGMRDVVRDYFTSIEPGQ
jgi:hypothetical protein